MPKPALAIAETAVPLAFAVGRGERSATICLSRGLIDQLGPKERTAILAHELAHVANRDVIVMSAASAIATLAGLVLRIAAWQGYCDRWFDLRAGRLSAGWNLFVVSMLPLALASLTGFAMLMVRLVLFVPLAALAGVYALSLPAVAALSRTRELAADRAAAILTGAPALLAAALLKLSGELERLPQRDLRSMALVNGLLVLPVGPVGGLLRRLTATHPPLRARVERLAAMQATLDGQVAGI